jgi:MFS family permease
MSRARLVACVLLPFAVGYFLSYLFRTINAVIAADLSAELGLSAADLGLLTSVYFLVFAAAQLPLGALLDRYGPSLVQSVLMLVASAGALLFALGDSLVGLIIGRGLIGLGVAVALMAGIKAIVTWSPQERSGLATGVLVTLGAFGGLTATGPAEFLVQHVGWRGLFVVLAGLSAIAALLLLFAAPGWPPSRTSPRATASFSVIYRDRRFWRIAPLAALGVGTSWSLQGLWAAPWLQDVEGLERGTIVQYLGLMALGVCASALLLGTATDRLRRVGVKAESLLIATLGLSMLAQAALILRWPLPPLLPWMIICAAGAATVLSYALLSEYFPKAMSARANGALNVMNVGSTFVLQSAAGFIIELWPETNGVYPVDAHQAAMGVPLGLQLAALAWFALPRRRETRTMQHITVRAGDVSHLPLAPYPYMAGLPTWNDQVRLARRRALRWRTAAIASMCVSMVLAALLVAGGTQAGLPALAAEVRPGRAPSDAAVSFPQWLMRQTATNAADPLPRSEGDAVAHDSLRFLNGLQEN